MRKTITKQNGLWIHHCLAKASNNREMLVLILQWHVLSTQSDIVLTRPYDVVTVDVKVGKPVTKRQRGMMHMMTRKRL